MRTCYYTARETTRKISIFSAPIPACLRSEHENEIPILAHIKQAENKNVLFITRSHEATTTSFRSKVAALQTIKHQYQKINIYSPP